MMNANPAAGWNTILTSFGWRDVYDPAHGIATPHFDLAKKILDGVLEADCEQDTNPTDVPTPDAEQTGPPRTTALFANAPNPFNPTTTIRFDLPRAVHVKLNIYNVKGELVSTIVDRNMTEGRKEFSWTATDHRGRSVASGIYFYHLVAGDFVRTKKMVLLR